tara:strand:- start:233 stop:445 length:213 start_codon:yes stop_codon:yes gene_type:complete
MNIFTRIAAAAKERLALTALAAQQSMAQTPDSWWLPHSAPDARRFKRILNRTMGHRQAKRNRMAALRNAA